jgi:hypothetical protein
LKSLCLEALFRNTANINTLRAKSRFVNKVWSDLATPIRYSDKIPEREKKSFLAFACLLFFEFNVYTFFRQRVGNKCSQKLNSLTVYPLEGGNKLSLLSVVLRSDLQLH